MKLSEIGGPGRFVWVQSGGVGWSIGQVLGVHVGKMTEPGGRPYVIEVGYGEFREWGGRHSADPAGWSRVGRRILDQLQPRDPALAGADKPATRGRDRRKRCGLCGRFKSPASYRNGSELLCTSTQPPYEPCKPSFARRGGAS